MIKLRPVTSADAGIFNGSSYEGMDEISIGNMISESLSRSHNGQYFEFMVIESDGECVGFMNLFALSETEISCGPEIKPQYRGHGYAFDAMQKALEYVKNIGFSTAASQVRKDNAASIALHNKLKFVCTREFVNKKGNLVCWFEKAI